MVKVKNEKTYKERLDELRKKIPEYERENFRLINENNFYWHDLTGTEKKYAKLGSFRIIEDWLQQSPQDRKDWFERVAKKINATIKTFQTEFKEWEESQPQQWTNKTWAYEALGVAVIADKAEIHFAWKRLTRKNHPNRGGDPLKFSEIQNAYQAIIFTA